MLSCPPAIMIEASPSRIACAASATARRPEPQTWLMVMAVRSVGMPALTAAWRAGFWPWPAVSTWPKISSLISSAATPAESSAARMATRPSSCAGVVAKLPRKLPTGVRRAEVITMSDMMLFVPNLLVTEVGRRGPLIKMSARGAGRLLARLSRLRNRFACSCDCRGAMRGRADLLPRPFRGEGWGEGDALSFCGRTPLQAPLAA